MKVMKILLFIGLDPKGHDCVKVLKSGLVRARFCKQCLIFSILRIFHYCNKTCVNLLFVLLLMKFGKKRIESANPSQNLAHFFSIQLSQPDDILWKGLLLQCNILLQIHCMGLLPDRAISKRTCDLSK